MAKKVTLDNCVSIIETFCDQHPGHVPARANSYEAGRLMVKYLTKGEYLESYNAEYLNDVAYLCLIESAA